MAKNSVNEEPATPVMPRSAGRSSGQAQLLSPMTVPHCHTPHGSTTNAPAHAAASSPFLCQDRHSGDHGAQVNSGANLLSGNVTTVNGINPLANAMARIQLNGRACLNCHVLVHGSNYSAGAKFQRWAN